MTKVRFTESELIKYIEDVVEEYKTPVLSEMKKHKLKNWERRFIRKNSKDTRNIAENFVNDINRLERNGITPYEVSAYLKGKSSLMSEQTDAMSMFTQGFSGNLGEIVRERLLGWLLKSLGVKDPQMREVFSLTLSTIPVVDLPKIMDCDYIVPKLAQSVVKYTVRQMVKATTGDVGAESSLTSVVIGTSLSNLVDNLEFIQDVETKLREVICNKLKGKGTSLQSLLDTTGYDSPVTRTTAGMVSTAGEGILGDFTRLFNFNKG